MEEWRDIKGYEGLYQVSNLGRVRSLTHVVTYKNRYGGITEAKYSGRIMQLDATGIVRNRGHQYMAVMLTKNGNQRRRLVHRLVAEAFIPNPENKPQVNHIDGDKANNIVSNLEWCTSNENMLHAAHEIKVLTSMFSPIQIKCLETGNTYKSTSEAARDLGLDRRSLSKAISNGENEFCGYHLESVGQE